jgi:hypothetical protein
MKERPFNLTAPEVRAVLAGTKKQKRIPVTAKHLPWIENSLSKFFGGEWGQRPMPYGQPGGRLWVREAFFPEVAGDRDFPVWYRATEEDEFPYRERWKSSIHMPRWASRITLEVTGVRVERLQDISEADAIAEGIERLPDPVIDGGWSGPNRFTLKGMGSAACAGYVSWNAPTATELYRRLWESINGPGSWEANPWVWVVEFKRLTEAT